MKRKRSIPWIHRWSRSLMAGIASVGAAITGYLAIVKLTGNATACPTNGCDLVLTSSYATVFGLPLALFGFLAYASMIVFALAPLLVNSSKQVQLRSNLQNWTGLLLVAGGTAMTVFSGYLMYLLHRLGSFISQLARPSANRSRMARHWATLFHGNRSGNASTDWHNRYLR